MTTNYDPISEQYQRSKHQPWRHFIECFTLMDLAGDLRGKEILDVACGEGFYSRLFRQQGARKVLGVDLSEGMIELARSQESQHRLGIEYLVGDAMELPLNKTFDLAMAAYLLNYAHDRDELQSMCNEISRSLKPGGRFVTVNCNPACDFSRAPSYRQYGFETAIVGDWTEGTPITWTFYLNDGSFRIENYRLNVATHEAALRNAGFREIRWHRPKVSPEGLQAHGLEFWSTFLNDPPIAFLECLK